MESATIHLRIPEVDVTKSFYSRVGDDYRLYIPKDFRENVVKVEPGDLVWLIVGTVIAKRERVILP
jgi:bifunctional DNA-binding transcriptional regulator/antitoxin component of YhaV-PrlF toxin-antitoxin module